MTNPYSFKCPNCSAFYWEFSKNDNPIRIVAYRHNINEKLLCCKKCVGELDPDKFLLPNQT